MSDRSTDREFLGVILAAGKGARIAPFSGQLPKPVLPILGKPLLQYQVESLRDLGVSRILIVIGHLGFEIVRALGDGSRWGVEIEYVDQGPTLGIAHALGKLESHLDLPFLLFLGDIFFLHRELARMKDLFETPDTHAVLAVKEEPSPEAIRRNFVVLEDEGGLVRRVIEKPRYPRTNLKGCGLYLFDPVIFDAVRRTPRTAMRDEYELTDAIQIMIDDGHSVRAARVIEDDLNLSYPRDLLDINLQVLGEGEYIGEGVRLADGCEVRRSVVMEGAVVEQPIRIEESLIFPHTHVSTARDLARSIVTPRVTIDCR